MKQIIKIRKDVDTFIKIGKETFVNVSDVIYIILNKPKGIVCTTDAGVEKDNIIDYINHPKRIFPIGRLDKTSEGLIFLTNDGDIVNKILRAKNKHEKEYHVTVDKPIDHDFIKQIRRMCEYLGYRVKRLNRIRIMNIKLDIRVGEWRYFSESELSELKVLLSNSSTNYAKK